MKKELEIVWFGPKAGEETATCLACQAIRPMKLVCEVSNLFVPNAALKFARCAQCASLTVIEGDLFEYTDDELAPEIWRHYMHVGAGIDFMVRPIQRVRKSIEASSLLDVGCGFGYTLDFARISLGLDIAGVEPSTYGRMGRDMLLVPIETCYLADAERLRERKFDIVFSSEVIEHVPDPKKFVADLAKHVSHHGVLILTTPNAAYISRDNTLSMVASALSPGLHKVLFSKIALETILRDAGFSHVIIEEQEERLIAFAGRMEFQLSDADRRSHTEYVSYLMRRASEPTPHTDLEIGFRYRAFKELVNMGRVAEAKIQAEALVAAIKQSFGFEPFLESEFEKSVIQCETFEQYATKAPYCLAPFLFYHAMMRRVAGEDPAECAKAFRHATKALAHVVQLAPIYAQEASSLLWRAVFEEGCALMAAKNFAGARSAFAQVLNFRNANNLALKVSGMPEDIIARAKFEESLAQASLEGRGQFAAFARGAKERPESVIRHILRRYAPHRVWNMLRYLRQRWRGK